MSKEGIGRGLVEAAINAYVNLDPTLREGLAEFTGKRLEISIKGTGVTFSLYFVAGGVRLVSHTGPPADVMLEATPSALLRLLMASEEGRAFPADELAVKGDVDDAQRIRSLLSRRHVDAEEVLARIVGDVAARQLGNIMRSLMDVGQRTTGTLFEDLGEFFTEESRLTPAHAELDALTTAIDSLRDDAERLDKRILRLQQRSRSEQGA